MSVRVSQMISVVGSLKARQALANAHNVERSSMYRKYESQYHIHADAQMHYGGRLATEEFRG
ncbi:hypothetical protein M404DRAFT_784656 [Pisolithus tinctorius Marx 270]|uniref:Uncharacterized protein n=1 Tax=Pisolithus tinctorius Marx 270 TaxID=870435 RepID=A0A0C3NX82_PISTI|nr:hypothetical protein M404DRAFT_784656 [Pisolithus tinctorius Marx 270]